MTPIATPRRIAHLTLPATDLQEAESFYVEILGLELVRRFDRETFLRYRPERAEEADAPNSPLHLELRCGELEVDVFLQCGMELHEPRPHPHLAFEVSPEELDAYRLRLAELGVPTDGPHRMGPPGHAALYFCDPSNNVLEVSTMGYRGTLQSSPLDVRRLDRR